MSYSPYYLFFDFDETLYVDKKIYKKTERALKKARKAGCKLFINTGRSIRSLLSDLKRNTDIKFDGYLCLFQQILLGDDGKDVLVETEYLSKDDLINYIDYCIRKSYWATLETPNDNYTIELHGDIFYTDEEKEVHRQKAINFIKNNDVIKVGCYPPKSVNHTAENIYEENPNFSFIRHPYGYEYCRLGYGKGKILEVFAEKLNLNKSKFIHFGDSENDLDAFMKFPTCVAMNISTPSIIPYASYIAKTKHGVAEYINKVLLKKIKKEKKGL